MHNEIKTKNEHITKLQKLKLKTENIKLKANLKYE